MTMDSDDLNGQKLLIANRGEIAVRILRTARRLGLRTVAIYTATDTLAPHVLLADEAVALRPNDADPSSNARGYLDAQTIADICSEKGVTLVHPGYGFLSENAEFAELLEGRGVTLLGPSAEAIRAMGVKHEALALARKANVPTVPGSGGLVENVEAALEVAESIEYPVMLKATAGGGGMGLVVCEDAKKLRESFEATRARAQTLFGNNGVFLEKYFAASRHIEVQVFGDGLGHAIHLRERECSVQRRHQKVIEESPSPFLETREGLRDEMCTAAVRLSESIRYKSAGTIEFLVDVNAAQFYFLEMNTRLQVEHPVTEQIFPDLDIVEMMIELGIRERLAKSGSNGSLSFPLDQKQCSRLPDSSGGLYAIEARVYCENPAKDFKPAPGLLQNVEFPDEDWLRVETWVETGTTISPFFDPLACKLIVHATTRSEALDRLEMALSGTNIQGPPNNVPYLLHICRQEIFRKGGATTTFLQTLDHVPSAIDVLAGGVETTIQDLPGRTTGLGIPPSGPMDPLAFQAANILVGNDPQTEALELALPGGMSGPRLYFHVTAVVAITGANARISVNGKEENSWSRLLVPAGATVQVGAKGGKRTEGDEFHGFRCYLAIRGGFPDVPHYLGSKSTSMGLGGYQGRSLLAGDHLTLSPSCGPTANDVPFHLPTSVIPHYPSSWTIHSLPGPHDDPTFFSPAGIDEFYSTHWTVSSSSNRMGVRLSASAGQPAASGIKWARKNGGEGGSHPSNIHDNGYALGSVNVNGDTPVILTCEGPSMGGYLCVATIASAELWKIGQAGPGSTIHFKRISFEDAVELNERNERWLDMVLECASGFSPKLTPVEPLLRLGDGSDIPETRQDPRLFIIAESLGSRPRVIFRQAGDSAILVEYGGLKLDFVFRARIHALETAVKDMDIPGIISFAPCIRSTMCHYNTAIVSQTDLLHLLIEVEHKLPSSAADMSFPGRKITFPIVLDDRWNRDALDKYMRTARDRAVYLPSNVEYLAKNNGLEKASEALELLVRGTWLVFGVGFYLACPFLVPVDPRCRLVGQKMNPSRTFTPRGAIGIAGLVAAIYPVESPGGYQLYGRTLPAWNTWGRGADFKPEQPWLLKPFDQVVFEVVPEAEYEKLEKDFDAGRYRFKIEPVTFSMKEYMDFVASIEDEVTTFKTKQAAGVAREEAREALLLREWQESQAQGSSAHAAVSGDIVSGSSSIAASMPGSVWKVTVKPGDKIQSAEDIVVVLEAMKTEINVEAGEENVGLVVKGFGPGIVEGKVVQAGDVLVVLDLQ